MHGKCSTHARCLSLTFGWYDCYPPYGAVTDGFPIPKDEDDMKGI